VAVLAGSILPRATSLRFSAEGLEAGPKLTACLRSLFGGSNSLFSRINSLFGLKNSLFLFAWNSRVSARKYEPVSA
jgi:hypothetical protein